MSRTDFFNGMDIGKLCMAFVVVAIHTWPVSSMNWDWLKFICSVIFPCAVPFFFLSRGYLLARKLESVSDCNGKVLILKSYLKKYIYLYCIWSIIYFPLAIWGYILDNHTLLGAKVLFGIIEYIRGFIFIGEHYNSWVLWYLLSTIYSILLLLIMQKRMQGLTLWL